jgi:hypothetical protein
LGAVTAVGKYDTVFGIVCANLLQQITGRAVLVIKRVDFVHWLQIVEHRQTLVPGHECPTFFASQPLIAVDAHN